MNLLHVLAIVLAFFGSSFAPDRSSILPGEWTEMLARLPSASAFSASAFERRRVAIPFGLRYRVGDRATSENSSPAKSESAAVVVAKPAAKSLTETLDYGLFGTLHLTRPPGDVAQTVLFFSDRDGWSPRQDHLSMALAAEGAFVVGIDLPTYLKKLAGLSGKCVVSGRACRRSRALDRTPRRFRDLHVSARPRRRRRRDVRLRVDRAGTRRHVRRPDHAGMGHGISSAEGILRRRCRRDDDRRRWRVSRNAGRTPSGNMDTENVRTGSARYGRVRRCRDRRRCTRRVVAAARRARGRRRSRRDIHPLAHARRGGTRRVAGRCRGPAADRHRADQRRCAPHRDHHHRRWRMGRTRSRCRRRADRRRRTRDWLFKLEVLLAQADAASGRRCDRARHRTLRQGRSAGDVRADRLFVRRESGSGRRESSARRSAQARRRWRADLARRRCGVRDPRRRLVRFHASR